MRLRAALQGDLDRMMAEEYARVEKAVTQAVGQAGAALKGELRAEVASAGLGRRLANTWRSETYPKGTASAGAAALVWTRAPTLIAAHAEGAVIRAVNSTFLAIPLPAAGNARRGGRITPAAWQQRTGITLRFVGRRGRPALLVADNARVSKSGRATASRSKTGRGAQTVPIFVLVPQVTLRKRLDPQPRFRKAAASIPGRLDSAFAVLDAGSRQ